MAYKFDRIQRVTEEIELGNGVIIKVDFNPDDIAKEYNLNLNRIIKAERAIKKLNPDETPDPDIVNEAMGEYGNAVIGLFNLIFGEENTNKIVSFYEDKYIEMMQVIYPFIMNVAQPRIAESINKSRENLAQYYKDTKKPNRAQRRKYGI